MEHTKNERSVVLTRHTYYQIVHDLWRALPPPVSDHPDELVCRDNAAIAEVASLLPADPAEAALACQFVAACAHAMDCLRLVKEHRAAFAVAMKCRAQAASMMRQACCAQSALLRIQQDRRKRAALGDTSANEPAWSDHGILDRVGEALRSAPPTDAPAQDLPGAQAVSIFETNSQNHADETLARPASPAPPIDDTRDGTPASGPPQQPNERPAAPSGRIAAVFSPTKRDLLASVAVIDAMTWTLPPAETRPRASAA